MLHTNVSLPKLVCAPKYCSDWLFHYLYVCKFVGLFVCFIARIIVHLFHCLSDCLPVCLVASQPGSHIQQQEVIHMSVGRVCAQGKAI